MYLVLAGMTHVRTSPVYPQRTGKLGVSAGKLAGREKLIFAERDRKLEEARKRRALARQSAARVLHSKQSEAGDMPRVS